jgi:hypothetical protein
MPRMTLPHKLLPVVPFLLTTKGSVVVASPRELPPPQLVANPSRNYFFCKV